MTLKFCIDTSPAGWIVNSDLPWYDVVGFGPAGFEAYARLRFMPDPTYQGQRSGDVDAGGPIDEADLVAQACALLIPETTTPDDCYFCLWDGWPGAIAPEPGGARVHLPNRDYHLFRGPATEAGNWGLSRDDHMPPAAFIWPADHAWCIASDVDPHWAGIGASKHAIKRLTSSPHLDIVEADPPTASRPISN